MQPPTLVLDNGAHSIKAKWSNQDTTSVFRNAISRAKADRRRNFVADELQNDCTDYGGLVFKIPFEKGILTNWEVEKTVWDRVFGSKCLALDPPSTRLLVTEPVFNLPNVQDHYDQMIFEEYDFGAAARCPAPSLVAYSPDLGQPIPECVLVVDSGFSFTHIVPIVRGAILSAGVRRIDVGGKLLTNHLKELVSFRQWYMMDQTSVMENAKEQCCFISEDWVNDWERASPASTDTSIVRTYVLPDFVLTSTNKLGYVRLPPDPTAPTSTPFSPQPPLATKISVDASSKGKGKGKEVAPADEEQLLQMGNERFTVPEVLFNPSTIDLNQAGLSETIAHSIASLPEEIQGMFWSNIICIGGTAGFPGFTGRLSSELRQLAPDAYTVRVTTSVSPTLAAVLASQNALAESPVLQNAFLTRAEYQEGGVNAARRKAAGVYWGPKRAKEELGLS